MNGIVFSVLGAILLGLGAYRQYCLCVCSSNVIVIRLFSKQAQYYLLNKQVQYRLCVEQELPLRFSCPASNLTTILLFNKQYQTNGLSSESYEQP